MILEAISFNLYAAGLVHARGRGKGRKGEREGGGKRGEMKGRGERGRGKKGEEKGRGRRVEREGTNVSLFFGSGM